jgi:hypothetical protein
MCELSYITHDHLESLENSAWPLEMPSSPFRDARERQGISCYYSGNSNTLYTPGLVPKYAGRRAIYSRAVDIRQHS